MDQPYRVMLVDDSPTQAAHITGVLEAQGWNVLWVATAEEAIDRISQFVPDMILVDYHLPAMQGDELCRQVRMRIDTRIIAMIMLTGDDSKEIEARALEAGADDFVRKSDNLDILVLRVRTMLRRARLHSAILDPSESCFRRPRILAVDDSATFLTFLRTQFENEAYELDATTSGSDAIEMIRKERYDCVIVDMVMPETSGISVCRQIDRMRKDGTAHPMILMLTAKEDSVGLTSALEAGADDFVGKSSEITVLKVRIRALLRRRFFEDENRRILAELKDKQIQIERARLEKEAAEARAGLVEELEQTAVNLRRSNDELERFAYVASHDLQEPLRMVASYLQLLEKRLDGQLDDDAREFMNYAVNGARRMKSLINDLLQYSRIGTRKNPPEPVRMNEALADGLSMLRASIEEAGATVTHDDLPTVLVDRTQVGQLLQNLIGNAIKFRSTEPPRIHVSAKETDDLWELAVADNGIGIDPKFHDRVFVVFQRLQGHDEQPGTGIGLSICKKIVERHGGRIWIESEPGRGATFHFTLPKVMKECSHERSAA